MSAPVTRKEQERLAKNALLCTVFGCIVAGIGIDVGRWSVALPGVVFALVGIMSFLGALMMDVEEDR